MHNFPNAGYILTLSLIAVTYTMGLWFRDIISEGTYLGNHTTVVQKGLNLGVALFITTEGLFFLAIFWAFFHSALSPTVELGGQWPPLGIEAINPFELPLLNTVILLSSGVTVTYAHHSLIQGNRKGSIYGLIYTVLLAIIFTGFQWVEYTYSSFTISDGIFGTCFYFGTGFTEGAPLLIDIISSNIHTISNNSRLSPYWVTGFSDAESSFVVKVTKDKTRSTGIRVIPEYTIELHARDRKVLEKIKDFYKVGTIRERVRNGRPSVIYSVQSIEAILNVIIPHFKQFPLLTQKQADFILFTKIVVLMSNKEHLTEEGLKKIISLRASMNKGLTKGLKSIFPEVVAAERPVISNQVILSPLWLVGFVDGEGCFYLKIRNNKQVSLIFLLTQHVRDLNLMNVIKGYLNCGIIEQVSTRPSTVNLVVSRLEDNLHKIIPIFLENTLITQKYLDFYYFNEVSKLMLNKEHLTEEGFKKILKIKELKKK